LQFIKAVAVYDRKTKQLIAGDPDKKQSIVEFVVYERWITKPDSKWIIAGKILPKF